ESTRGAIKKAIELIQALGLEATATDESPEAEKVAATGAFDAVIVGVPGGEAVVKAALARGLDRPSTIITVAPGERQPAEVAAALSADTVVHRPLKRESLAIALRIGMLLRKQRRRLAELETKLA